MNFCGFFVGCLLLADGLKKYQNALATFGSRPAAGRQPHSAVQLLRTGTSPPNPFGVRAFWLVSDGKVNYCSWLTPAPQPPCGKAGRALRRNAVSLRGSSLRRDPAHYYSAAISSFKLLRLG